MDPALKNIFDSEKLVFTNLQSYNLAYTNYAMCKSEDSTLANHANSLAICRPGMTGYIPLEGKAQVVNDSLERLKQALDVYNNSTDKTYKKTTIQYDASLSELKENYKTLLNSRATLDLQIQDLYNGKGSVSSMNKLEMDAAIYANILWIILATSLIYFIFIKL